MSNRRQIRKDIEDYKRLERIVKKTNKPKSLCSSLIVEMFEKILTKEK